MNPEFEILVNHLLSAVSVKMGCVLDDNGTVIAYHTSKHIRELDTQLYHKPEEDLRKVARDMLATLEWHIGDVLDANRTCLGYRTAIALRGLDHFLN